ncbi:hypothetical protein M419DRAFT_126369 [Trichoderma reesei RUT C-30]|uniref:Uncharacterized protein n=1 Tax=Hypocrea jecorina (strain ATCC 56765 / BCRC 32924 / NRRL 11460 / Rut C-30) TaxID=1344414 RepID=A0A024SLJ9_HYPJR|nr:hypothetical protein M419DRAFT_126369 [Trichoderma reesei RUT C-30]
MDPVPWAQKPAEVVAFCVLLPLARIQAEASKQSEIVCDIGLCLPTYLSAFCGFLVCVG